jgi:hypothetical protein
MSASSQAQQANSDEIAQAAEDDRQVEKENGSAHR